MAKGRMVSRSIASNVRLSRCRWEADFLFRALIPFLDSAGRMSGEPESVWQQCVALRRELTPAVVEAALAELDAADLIVWYRHEGERYLWCPGFFRHNTIRREAPSHLPSPDGAERVSGRAVPSQAVSSGRPAPAVAGRRHAKGPGKTNPRSRALAAETAAAMETAQGGDYGPYSKAFEAAWAMYPSRPNNPKKAAFEKWRARLNEGATEAELTAAVERYAKFCAAERTTGTTKVMQATTFFGPGERWKDKFALVGAGPESPILVRARVLLALCKRYGLLALPPSEGHHQGGKNPAYKAKVSMAEMDAEAGPDFKRELATARPWEGLSELAEDRLMEEEVARRLGWRAPSREPAPSSGAARQREAVLRTVGNAALAAAAAGLPDEEAMG